MYQQIKKTGFGIVEMLLAMGIFLILVLGGSIFLTQGFNINRLADQETQATYYAAEGLEAVRSIANQSWPSLEVGNTTCGGTLQRGVTVPTTTWSWSGSPQTRDIFSRTITLSNVCRDGSGNISNGGTVYDANLKKITSTVNWSFSPTRNNTISVSNYLSNFRALIPSVIGDWSNISVESELDLQGSNDGLKIGASGDFAYIIRSGGSPDFYVINISTTTPSLTSSLSLAGNLTNIFVLGNFAYVTSDDNSNELQIINISNPASPTLVGTYNASGTADATDIYVNGTTAYFTRQNSGSPEFYIINVSNSNSPSTIGSLNLNGNAMAVAVEGNYAAVASTNNSSELELINISNPSSPSLSDTFDIGGNTDGSAVLISDSYVLLGTLGGWMTIVDISNPTNIIYANTYGGAGGSIYDTSTGNDGEYMFLATSAVTREIQVADISNKTSYIGILGEYYYGDTLNGIFYDPNRDRAYAVSRANNAELVVFKPQ